MKVYCISGLASDRRAFQYLDLPDEFEIVHLDWMPFLPKESLAEYAARLALEIDQDEPFVLIGLSMGGMIASEIARICEPYLTILISSIPLSNQLPGIYTLAGKIKLHKVLPGGFFKSASLVKRLFTRETPKTKALIKEIIKDSDPVFIKRAMEAILGWKNTELPSQLIQIHGSRDELLPLRCTNPDYVIEDGSHLMIMTKCDEINTLIKKLLIEKMASSEK